MVGKNVLFGFVSSIVCVSGLRAQAEFAHVELMNSVPPLNELLPKIMQDHGKYLKLMDSWIINQEKGLKKYKTAIENVSKNIESIKDKEVKKSVKELIDLAKPYTETHEVFLLQARAYFNPSRSMVEKAVPVMKMLFKVMQSQAAQFGGLEGLTGSLGL